MRLASINNGFFSHRKSISGENGEAHAAHCQLRKRIARRKQGAGSIRAVI
jgi:hypothetical protein